MLETIKSQNSFITSIKSASIAFSIVTIISVAIAGIANSRDKFTSQLGAYASLIGTGCGAIFGLVLGNKSRERKSPAGSKKREDRVLSNSIWQDWQNFVVVRKVRESEEITSFYWELLPRSVW